MNINDANVHAKKHPQGKSGRTSKKSKKVISSIHVVISQENNNSYREIHIATLPGFVLQKKLHHLTLSTLTLELIPQ